MAEGVPLGAEEIPMDVSDVKDSETEKLADKSNIVTDDNLVRDEQIPKTIKEELMAYEPIPRKKSRADEQTFEAIYERSGIKNPIPKVNKDAINVVDVRSVRHRAPSTSSSSEDDEPVSEAKFKADPKDEMNIDSSGDETVPYILENQDFGKEIPITKVSSDDIKNFFLLPNDSKAFRNPGYSKFEETRKEAKIQLRLDDYEPSEIHVSTRANLISIRCEHGLKEEGQGKVRRTFHRTYTLRKRFRVEDIKAYVSLSPERMLSITIPKISSEVIPEKDIPLIAKP